MRIANARWGQRAEALTLLNGGVVSITIPTVLSPG